MAFTYRIVERKNAFKDAKTPMIASARAKMIGRITTQELAQDIADRCTVHRADVKAVLDVLSTSITSFVRRGYGVQLGELGSFSFSIRGKSAPSKEEWKSELLTRASIRYTPSVEMKDAIKRTSFQNIESLLATDAENKGKPTPEGNGSNQSEGGVPSPGHTTEEENTPAPTPGTEGDGI